jgi:hypothetical protein
MKAIINGKRYDTAKAILIGKANNIGTQVSSKSDFGYWEAGLYKTPRSGVFFLAGEGGAMSMFSSSCGGGMRGYGSGIIPMSNADALEWAAKHLDMDDVEEHFADAIEDA